mmetsp:Transcript_6956/g.9642  ORF Transcript_6956/g.9642 Transcript_6956/m.9642 type:complete len:94 (-) Transcript_6956:1891-2172(-)
MRRSPFNERANCGIKGIHKKIVSLSRLRGKHGLPEIEMARFQVDEIQNTLLQLRQSNFASLQKCAPMLSPSLGSQLQICALDPRCSHNMCGVC